jgi:hypothetical protein
VTTKALTATKQRRDNGLKVALLFEDGYGNWGWVCWTCTRPEVHIGQDDFATRGSARRAAHGHELRRGH